MQKRIGDFERRKEKILFPQAGLNKIFLLPSLPLHPIIPRPSKKKRPAPPPTADYGGRQSQQKFLFLLVWRAQKSFSIKETIFAGFAFLLTQGRAAPTPCRAKHGRQSGKKFPPLKLPSTFCPTAERKEFSQVYYARFSTTQKPDARIGFLHYSVVEINLLRLLQILAPHSLDNGVDCVSSKREDYYNNQQTNDNAIGAECYDTANRGQ